MLMDRIKLVEGAHVVNLVVASGANFPANANLGELFFKTTAPAGLHYHNGTSWALLTTGTPFDPLNVASDLLPSTSSTYDIGSTTNRWKDVYVDEMYLSGNTLYLGNTPVMGTNNTTIEIKADPDQSMLLKTSGIGGTTVQSTTQVSIVSSGSSGVGIGASGANADVIVSATDDIQFSSTRITMNPVNEVTINGSLTVTGVTSLTGSTFLIDGMNFRTEDNVLYINYGEVGSGVTSGVAGIQVDRGSSADFQFVFDETDDRFKVGLVGDLEALATHPYVEDAISTHAGDATIHLTTAQNTLLDGLSATLTSDELNYVDGVTSPIQNQIDAQVAKGGSTMSGQLNMGNNKITSLLAPISTWHAANKNFVLAAVGTLTWKDAAVAATTANITLSGTQTIDTYAVSVGNRVLVKNQTNSAQNGIYVVATSAWTRSTDADAAADLDHASVFVEHGTQAGTSWTVGTGPATLGTDPVVWNQMTGISTIIPGTGLSAVGNELNVNLGAGIFENPSDQIGIDLYTGGGLMLTIDGTNASTDEAAQLSQTKTGVTSSIYTSVTVDVYGRITNGTNPTTLAGYGITDASSSVHDHTFASLTSKPTTLAGYGITDASTSTHTHTFAEMTSKPTTLAGYGITDAAASSHAHTGVYLAAGGGSMSGALTVNALLSGNGIINGYKDGQTNYATAGLQSTSTAGNAGVGLHCAGSSAVFIEHVRNGSGIHVRDHNYAYANVYANYLVASGAVYAGNAANATCLVHGDANTTYLTMDAYDIFRYERGSNAFATMIGNLNYHVFSGSGMYPYTDNTGTCGTGSNRWNAFYAVYGAIVTSDKREKNHIENIENVGAIVDAIQPVRFSWKSTGKTDIGFYAQDVQPFVPEAVIEGNDEEAWGMRQDRMVAILWAEVKSLRARVAQREKLLGLR